MLRLASQHTPTRITSRAGSYSARGFRRQAGGSGNQRSASNSGGSPVGPWSRCAGRAARMALGLRQVAGEGLLAGLAAAPGVGHLAVRAVADVGQGDRWPGRPGGVPPQAGTRVEPVVREQPVTVGGDQLDRGGDEAGRGLRDEVVEVDPGPAGFDPVAAVADLLAQGCERAGPMASSRCPYGPAQEQPPRAWMPNRSLSSATTKLWCRYRAPWRMRNETMDSRAAWWLPRISMPGLAAQRCSTCRHSRSSRAAIRSVPTACLRAKHQAGPDGLDDGRGAALLARDRVVEVAGARWGRRTPRCPRRGRSGRCCGPARGGRRGRRGSAGRRGTCAATGTPRPCGRPRPGRRRRSGSAGRARRRRSPRTTAPRGRAAGVATAPVSVRMPVTLEAAEKLPIRSGRRA